MHNTSSSPSSVPTNNETEVRNSTQDISTAAQVLNASSEWYLPLQLGPSDRYMAGAASGIVAPMRERSTALPANAEAAYMSYECTR